MKPCQLPSVWKILEIEFFYSPSTLILHWIKLENFVMKLKRQAIEAWQNEKHDSKENNTIENPIPRREIFKSVQSCEVRRSGQVTTFVVSAVFSLSFQGDVLLMKTTINHRLFLNLVWGEWMDLRNSNGIESRNFYFTTVWKLFSKIFIRSGKRHHMELNSGTYKSSK